MTLGEKQHAALASFTFLQELTLEGGPRTLLARSRGGSFVLVKIITDAAISRELSTALAREGSAAALTHDAIIQTRALMLEDDLAAIVTEFIHGVSLQRFLRFAASRGVRLPDDAAFFVLGRILSALAYAHQQKDGPVIHRAVLPEAVVIGWDGLVKLGDFGLDRMQALVTPTRRREDAIVAPEQARGAAADQRSDVFCAALLAVRLLTGRTPYARFRNSRAERLLAMAEGTVTPLARSRPDLAAPVRDAIDLALAPDPVNRTITAQELLEIVRGAADARRGEESLLSLVARWRADIEKSIAPWESRASMADLGDADVAPPADVLPGLLAVATPDDRPSLEPMTIPVSDPWRKDALPKDEIPLLPTDAKASLSRMGSIAPEALSVPLPAMKITGPPLPTYGYPAPKEERPLLSGGRGAAIVFLVFGLLVASAFFLIRSLMGPS